MDISTILLALILIPLVLLAIVDRASVLISMWQFRREVKF